MESINYYRFYCLNIYGRCKNKNITFSLICLGLKLLLIDYQAYKQYYLIIYLYVCVCVSVLFVVLIFYLIILNSL